MASRNLRIFEYFKQGKIKDAILGENNFFIPSVTFREQHDRLLVFRQLCIWSETNKKANEASRSVEEIIEELYSQGNLLEMIDVVWCFLLVYEDGQCALSIDMEKMQSYLVSIVKNNSCELSTNDNLRELVIALSTKLPKFKYELSL